MDGDREVEPPLATKGVPADDVPGLTPNSESALISSKTMCRLSSSDFAVPMRPIVFRPNV